MESSIATLVGSSWNFSMANSATPHWAGTISFYANMTGKISNGITFTYQQTVQAGQVAQFTMGATAQDLLDSGTGSYSGGNFSGTLKLKGIQWWFTMTPQ